MPTRAALRGRSSFLLLVLLLESACGGGTAAPAPPTDFTATQSGASFDDISFSWSPPPGGLSGYEAEGRLEDGPWESIGPIDADVIGGTITLDSSVPELTHFTFRIRSVRSGKVSSWVEARYLRALRWPMALSSDHPREGIRLAWSNASTAATGVRLSRRFGESWRVMAELPPTAEGWVDGEQLVAAQGVQYRLTATAGDVESLPAEHYDEGYPPVAVFDLTATPEPGGVRLRWVNPPVATGSIEIHRAEGLVAAYFSNIDPVVLPSIATEYLDPLPGGTWTWHVVTRYPAGLGAPWAQVRGISNPLGPVALQGSLVSLPDASAMASDGQGRLGFAIGGSWYPPATGPSRLAFRGTGAPADVDLGTGHGFAEPQIAFDPGGRPHTVVLRPAAGSSLVSVVHVWHDGAAWSEEEVARRPLDDPTTVRFALDADGALHLAWSTKIGSVRVEYARAPVGSWAIEDLTAALPDDARVAAFDVDGLGTPSIAVSSGAGALLARRDATWTADAVPLAGWVTDVRRSPTGLDLVGTQCVGPIEARTGELVLLERGGGGWGPAQLVRALAQCLPVDALSVARSAVGDRSVVWGSVDGFLELDLREAASWTHVETRPAVGRASAAWFDGAGRLHLLVRSDGYAEGAGLAPYIEYVEP